ncbi:interleukin-12 receptor subunit beta-2 isoform X2 [Brienomyrus brachyistius]|uniref:interleukin-12 receptor subunit beta-2 isoform X2 n=1 Tax=Brienomyrus brachyistius TaxID=42636 RepID=UPI0020B2DDCE|nr:interleukin-12 receptor subunit beta-2 isoform X2 [Brienomyrus brachyistius]
MLGHWCGSFIKFIWFCGIQTIAAQKPCDAVSEVGPVVQMGSSFKVYCVFRNIAKHCKQSIHLNKMQIYDSFAHNSTAIFVNVNNIMENRTYTCKCACCTDPCGLDLQVGYRPDEPQNVSCSLSRNVGNVTCTWTTGRKTYIRTMSNLWVKPQSLDSSAHPVSFPGFGSATFPVFGVWSRYSVWVNVSNKLGTVLSLPLHFSLSDIVKPPPPDTVWLSCASRQCVLYWSHEADIQLHQVKYRKRHGNWTIHPIIDSGAGGWTISDLQPFTAYDVQIRSKLSSSQGLWSEWSGVITDRTEEEAPIRLDVWYIEESFSSGEKSFTVLWKELNESEARGRILGYKLEVRDFSAGGVREYITPSNQTRVRVTCSSCTISVAAFNSKGHSPPALINIPQHQADPPQNVVCQPLSNHSIAISWQTPATTETVKGYLVQWFAAHRHGQDLQWKRVGQNELNTSITETIQPFECYQGAVFALYEQGSGKQDFIDAHSRESAPTLGPTPITKVTGNRVVVSWSGIPLEHQRGCLRAFIIYLKREGGEESRLGPIKATQRMFSISGLKPGEYSLFMSSRTGAGEGPRGDSAVFLISQNDTEGFIIIPVILLCFPLLMVIYLCLTTSAKRLLPKSVPDPANSKWAKECTASKGEMTLELHLNCSALDKEPHTMEIEEIEEKQALTVVEEAGGSSAPEGSTSEIPAAIMNCAVNQIKPVCSYIKSFSHESDNSVQTELSTVTDITVDYISSNGLLDMDCEMLPDDVVESDFFPSFQSTFSGPLVSFGGRLTLDSVKMDWNGLFN